MKQILSVCLFLLVSLAGKSQTLIKLEDVSNQTGCIVTKNARTIITMQEAEKMMWNSAGCKKYFVPIVGF